MPLMPGSIPNDDNTTPSNVVTEHLQYTKRYMTTGFFKPYSGMGDFGKSLVEPVIFPLKQAFFTGFFAIVTAASAISAAACLIFAGGAALFGNKKLAETSLALSKACLILAGLATLATAALVLLAAVAFPVAVIKLVTRSVSTLVTPLVDCCSSKEPTTEDMSPIFQP